MSQPSAMNAIELDLKSYDTITLDQLNLRAPLLQRRDRKYIFNVSCLHKILLACIQDYEILEVDAQRCISFVTTYFDTPELLCYYDHHRGRSPRFKIRYRIYGNGNDHLLEVKMKTAGDKTKKIRKKLAPAQIENFKLTQHVSFFESCDIPTTEIFENKLEVHYSRITLLHKKYPEKITLDINLSFHEASSALNYDNIVIAEIKSEHLSNSFFSQLMRKMQIPEGGISKYCLGIISLHPTIKFNNFKPIIRRIQKLNIHDNIITNSLID